MKAVILAGGLGTWISGEPHLRPKPMIEIGGKPILWHIMKSYAQHGITDFLICYGYIRNTLNKELSVWQHHGFWAAMDTLRDRNFLEDMRGRNAAPRKTWS